MLQTTLPFKNYEEFKELFGLQEHGNGVKSRKNKILLAFYKSASVRQYIRDHEDYELASIRTMQALKHACLSRMTGNYHRTKFGSRSWEMYLNGRFWYSPTYETDYMKGQTEDGDTNSIRYINKETNRVFKMRAGKMYNHLIANTLFGDILPIQVTTWLCEELVTEWCGYNTANSQYELHVDENFSGIYDEDDCKGNFGSCMAGEGYYSFYADAVKAKAAYLTDADGYIVARAIIYTECIDEDGQKWRLCERQYSTEGDEVLKQILVSKLLAADQIDGYKKVGAGCHDSRLFVGKDGSDLTGKKFYIRCYLEDGDTLSYQDSFKYFNEEEQRAYNHDNGCYDVELTSTCGRYASPEPDHSDEFWDDYYDEWVDAIESGWRDGRRYDVGVDALQNSGDWTWVDTEDAYYYYDEVVTCAHCDQTCLKEDAYYSELLDEWYCDEDCLNYAEEEYYEENPEERPVENEAI